MQTIFRVYTFFLLLTIGFSCRENASDVVYQCPMQCEKEKTYSHPGDCPICKMELKLVSDTDEKVESDGEVLETSVFNLTSTWQTQNNDTIELSALKGNVFVVVMIYTSCQSACPRLVADMRNIHDAINNDAVRYVLVSIDPETDTPKRLKEFAIENEMDTEQWIFLHGQEDDVREFSNVVAVKYKKISPLDFSHSNIISVFDREGVLQFQQEGLGVANDKLVAVAKKLAE